MIIIDLFTTFLHFYIKCLIFFFKQKTAYEMRISYWSSDVCSSDLVKPGTPGLLHRIGGIEKEIDTGHINYAPGNHQAMTDIRKAKIDGIKVPDQIVELGAEGGKLAVVGWGSTFGPIHQAARRKRAEGVDVSHVHIRHIWPLPANLGELLKSFDKVIVPEMNTGQLKTVLRDPYLVAARPDRKSTRLNSSH